MGSGEPPSPPPPPSACRATSGSLVPELHGTAIAHLPASAGARCPVRAGACARSDGGSARALFVAAHRASGSGPASPGPEPEPEPEPEPGNRIVAAPGRASPRPPSTRRRLLPRRATVVPVDDGVEVRHPLRVPMRVRKGEEIRVLHGVGVVVVKLLAALCVANEPPPRVPDGDAAPVPGVMAKRSSDSPPSASSGSSDCPSISWSGGGSPVSSSRVGNRSTRLTADWTVRPRGSRDG